MNISSVKTGPRLSKRISLPGNVAFRNIAVRGILFLAASYTTFSGIAQATDTSSKITKTLSIRSTNAHGANFFNGDLITRYDNVGPYLSADAFAFWQNFSVREVGVLDNSPDATDGATITRKTDRSTLMATINAGVVPTESGQLNNPIHDTPIISGLFTSDRSYLPVAAAGISKFKPVRNPKVMAPVTLQQWESADGRIRLTCLEDGSGKVVIRARNLLAGIPYTVWAVFATDKQSSFGFLEANPMGGVPNIMLPDERGSAKFSRNLHYCPLETSEPLMYVALYAHWDTAVYGGNPDAGDQGFPTGVVGGDQLVFVTGDNLHRIRYW